jgi:hypothetical protein
MRHYINLIEKIIVRDDAASDVDGKMRQVALHLNPSREETAMLMSRCVEKEIRGFVGDRPENAGQVIIWDAYLTDHAGAGELLRNAVAGDWWMRFSMSDVEFRSGIIRNYIDQGAGPEQWAMVPLRHLARMLGQEPTFKET